MLSGGAFLDEDAADGCDVAGEFEVVALVVGVDVVNCLEVIADVVVDVD